MTTASFARRDFCLPRISGKLLDMPKQRAASRVQLERLRAAVSARRRDLDGLTIDAVARRGGPSTTTLSKIERAEETPSLSTLRKLDTSLEWEPGSAYHLLWDDRDPVPIGEPEKLGRQDAARVISLADAGGPLRRLVHIRDEIDKVIAELRDEPPG